MIEIKDTSSVFQLAFGLNAVILVIYQNSYQKRKELLDYVTLEIKKHYKNVNIENEYILNSFPSYKKIKYLFFFFISLSFLSILCSFYYLVKAVLEPESEMCENLFIFLSTFLILVNPVLYYIYKVILDSLISLIKDKNTITKDTAIYMSESMNSLSKYKESKKAFSKVAYELNKIFFRRRLERFKNKLNNNPFLHPIKWYENREMRKFSDEMFKEKNIK